MRQINFLNRIVILSIVFLFLVVSAQSATFTVNVTTDGSDVTPGDGVCGTGIGINCTLRAAIEEANAFAGTDTIAFSIGSPGGVRIITPNTVYPTITQPVIIDGWTQGGAGYTGSPLIELVGSNVLLADSNGLLITAGFTTIRGLAINRFVNQIQMPSSFNTIQGCYLGTNTTGTSTYNGQSYGIVTTGTNNLIGGSITAYRNIISGLVRSGIYILGSFATGNTIIGNYIGTNVSGTASLNNPFSFSFDQFGILIEDGSANTIGGTTAGERNVISGNDSSGIKLSETDANIVIGNYIGTDVNGTADLGNGIEGVDLHDSSNNVIGGLLAGEANTIAFNVNGIALNDGSTGNSVRGNSILSNAALGIDLNSAGLTPNDTDDPDTGANNLQNFPLLTDASTSGGSTTVQGSLNSTPSTSFNVDFYSNASCDSSGYGEGEIYIGSKTITTDAGGDKTFTFIPAGLVPQGRYITATATRTIAPLDTSEFSECVQVINPNSTVVTNTADAGAGSLRQAILNTNALIGFDTITFNIPGAGVQTMNLLSALPTVTDPVIIDGASQPGFTTLPLIELNGAGAGAGADGIRITSGLSTVKSLIINRFNGAGIVISLDGSNTIIGCFIGTDATGTIDLGNAFNGINISSSFNRVGGASPLARNLISGNNNNGILLTGAFTTDNSIVGNIIGTDINRTIDLGNTFNGVLLSNTASRNTIGGAAGSGNTIAYNSSGVYVLASTSVGNQIRGNSIYSNNNLGIDLFPNALTPNDAGDADTGANGLQNFPVLTNAFNIGGSTQMQGSLSSAANTAFTIDFFSSQSCDSSGNGEGEIFIGSQSAATDAGGNVIFTFTPGSQVQQGRFITTTATRRVAPLDTSEFSQCFAVAPAPGNLTFSSATYSVNEGAGVRTITVNRTGGSVGQITVDYYTTTGGTATAGVDYTATNGTLTFLSGETVKTFDIPITNDPFDETDETFVVRLDNPSFGVSITPNASATVTIVDNDPPPTISITDVSLEEGNSGTTNFTFNVNLSAPSGLDISVNYATANGSATGSIDYAATAGTLNFSAASAQTSKTVTVVVNGDLTPELNETFFVNLSNPVNAGFGDNQGLGTILDDDNPGKFSFTATPYSGVENTQVLVTVSRTNGDAGTVSVDYLTSGGSATPTVDYDSAFGTLFFGDGETVKTFTVNLLDDPQPEPTENFNVVLSNPIGGAILGVPSVASVNILDNDSGTLLTIAGEILRTNGAPLVGATVNLTGAQTGSATTNNLGRYSFTNLAPNGNYSIAPAALGFTFNPINRQYNNLSADVTNANFTATAAPTRQLRIVGGNAAPTQNITAIVELVAQGDENSVAFSLNFDQTILMNPTVVLNADAATATIFANTSQSASGRLGVLLALPAGQAFTVGTKSLVTVTFNTTATNLYSSPVTFGDVPIVKQTANTNADPLPTNYLDGAVTFAQGWEADLAPRPTGNNNGSVTVTDFTQVGRFAAGLDTNYQLNEFQRADCAPRISLGNGAVSVTDYTQAGRYAAGLDAANPTGGQYAPSLFEFDDTGKMLSKFTEISDENNLLAPTNVRVVNIDTSPGMQVLVSIETVAQGTENGFGFTLNYDAAKLSNPSVSIGAGIPGGSTLIPNTLTAGRVGVILGLPFGTGLAAGTKQLVTIRFDVANNAGGGLTALTFGDMPVVREVADLNAQTLSSGFQSGAVNILGPTAAAVSVGGRVLNTNNQGISGVSVSLTDASGNSRTTRTNSFGYYRFADVAAGETYVLTAKSKNYRFDPQVISVSEDLTEINLTANPNIEN